MTTNPLLDTVGDFWDREILPTLVDYIRIPALSPDFDAAWAETGHLTQARRLALDWLERHREGDWTIHDLEIPELTPLLLVEIPGQKPGNVVFYGHLDKQPEMEGWREDLGPWKPVIEGGRLYGRGGADDGYALFAAVAAVKALRQRGSAHPRCLILIEFSEESGSPHLPPYLEQYGHIIGTPDLVVALDSGTGDYERLWSTTSLRGMQGCTVTVQTLEEAAHSGIASGIVPESFAVMRQILDRLEDAASGRVRLEELHVTIPEIRKRQAREVAEILGMAMVEGLHPLPGLQALSNDPYELILNNTWRPSLCVVGQDGLPPVDRAGNVMRAYTSLKLSFRLPPPVRCEAAKRAIEEAVLRDPPFGARIDLRFDQGGDGWEAPEPTPWLLEACDRASLSHFGRKAAHLGLGASIPFMKMLGDRFPQAQFLITGVLGPGSNAHGPNEFLHIPYAKRLTACVADILAACAI